MKIRWESPELVRLRIFLLGWRWLVLPEWWFRLLQNFQDAGTKPNLYINSTTFRHEFTWPCTRNWLWRITKWRVSSHGDAIWLTEINERFIRQIGMHFDLIVHRLWFLFTRVSTSNLTLILHSFMRRLSWYSLKFETPIDLTLPDLTSSSIAFQVST